MAQEGDENGYRATLPICHSIILQPKCQVTSEESHEESLRVQRHDIIKIETGTGCPAQQKRKVIDTDEHTDNTLNTEIFLLVKVEEISKPGHPHVRTDEDADPVVGRPCSVVMVHDECELHPSLPFFRLRAREEGDPVGGRVTWRSVFPSSDKRYCEDDMRDPE